MSERKEYEMTDAEHAAILDACKPVPYMVFDGVGPASPQQNANDAWARLGRERKFRPMSVKPVAGKSDRFFTAVPTDD